MAARSARRHRPGSAGDAGGGVRGLTWSLADISSKTEQELRRLRTWRTITGGIFAIVTALGVVVLCAFPRVGLGLLGIALIVLGVLNVAIASGGLVRVIGELRQRVSERQALARENVDEAPARGNWPKEQ